MSDKPGPLRETVFENENYKLKYSAAQARLFLRLIPFFLSQLHIDWEDLYYQFAIELLEINQLMFSPVISSSGIQHLSQLIEEHLHQFKILFPEKNILPKQHYMIHVPNMIKKCGPIIRSSCFAFESAHCYFNQIAQKQNFKNIAQSLGKRYQLLDCVNFGNTENHPLFHSEKKIGKLTALTNDKQMSLRLEMDKFGLLPGVHLSMAFSASWITLHGTKYSKGAVVAVMVTHDRHLPIFGVLENIFIISDFEYFDVKLYVTSYFEHNFLHTI